MPAKKKKIEAAEPEQVDAAPEAAPEATPTIPDNAHTYYVFKDGVCVKMFINEVHKGDAKKFATQYADDVGGTVEASGTYH